MNDFVETIHCARCTHTHTHTHANSIAAAKLSHTPGSLCTKQAL